MVEKFTVAKDQSTTAAAINLHDQISDGYYQVFAGTLEEYVEFVARESGVEQATVHQSVSDCLWRVGTRIIGIFWAYEHNWVEEESVIGVIYDDTTCWVCSNQEFREVGGTYEMYAEMFAGIKN